MSVTETSFHGMSGAVFVAADLYSCTRSLSVMSRAKASLLNILLAIFVAAFLPYSCTKSLSVVPTAEASFLNILLAIFVAAFLFTCCSCMKLLFVMSATETVFHSLLSTPLLLVAASLSSHAKQMSTDLSLNVCQSDLANNMHGTLKRRWHSYR